MTKKPKREKRKNEWTTVSPGTVGIILAILFGFPALIGLQSHPTVSLDSPLDVKNVFSTPLILSNDGMMSLQNVRVLTFVINAQHTNGDDELMNIALGYVPPSGTMEIGEKKTVAMADMFSRDVDFTSGDFALIVKFTPAYMPFWTKRRPFRFQIVRGADGNLRFIQNPSENTLDLYFQALKIMRPNNPDRF
jgi:hypothetical protein